MNKRTTRLLLGSTLAAVAATALIGCNKAPDDSAATTAPTNSPTASTGTTMGTDVSDTAITASVKSALLADDVVKGLDVQVETRKGTVQLSGFVDSQAQIDQAVVLTRAVSGVNFVENGITLKGGAGGMGTQMDDTAVTGRVKTALLADPDIKSLDISVLTSEGTVQLTGFVKNKAQIDKAVAIAGAAEGAKTVKNELMVKK
jgi:hyperosmotically inducible periplasmic protein